jgi:hypothetical protein
MHDRSFTALKRQLKGLGLDELEVTFHGPDRTHIKSMKPADIMAELPRFKRANMSGCNIYVRGPRDCDHDLILIDDLSPFTPDRMKAAGHSPAVVVQTSPGNVQAWVRLGRSCSAPVRHEIARQLARLYEGDPGAVDPHQSGRLAGMTNRKPQHRTARGYPYVLLLNAPGKAALAADDLIRGAERAILDREGDETQASVLAAEISANNGKAADDLVGAWRREYEQRGGDLSAIDYAVSCQALKAGIDLSDIAAALEIVADRKGKHAASYAERTIQAASGSTLEPFPPSP